MDSQTETDMASTKRPLVDLGPNDVLLGRGTGPNENAGNVKFRALVREVIRISGLRELTGKSKSKLARQIVKEVQARGGRFVRKLQIPGTKRDVYMIVGDRQALDKAKQSFRHQLRLLALPPNEEDSSLSNQSTNSQHLLLLSPTQTRPEENTEGPKGRVVSPTSIATLRSLHQDKVVLPSSLRLPPLLATAGNPPTRISATSTTVPSSSAAMAVTAALEVAATADYLLLRDKLGLSSGATNTTGGGLLSCLPSTTTLPLELSSALLLNQAERYLPPIVPRDNTWGIPSSTLYHLKPRGFGPLARL